MILGIITSEGSTLSHAAIIARARKIPSLVQVGRDFLDDCDGRIVVLDADQGVCILDPDAATRQQAVTRICTDQRASEGDMEMPLQDMPCMTRDGVSFELLANCFGPEDIDSAIQSGAAGVGLLRSDYQILAGDTFDEQEQYFYYTSCIAAAGGKPVTVRTFDFGSDRTLSNIYRGDQSAHLGMRGIRSSLRSPRRFEAQIRALMRAAARGPLRIVFPMVTNVEDWDDAMKLVAHCRQNLEERGVPYNSKVPFGIMLSIPAACLIAEDFARHGCQFFVIGTNDLTQYTHAAGREITSAERYFQPTSKAMYKLIRMSVDAAKAHGIPVGICGLAVGDPDNAVQYLHMGLRSFSMGPQNLLSVKKALLDAEAIPHRPARPSRRADHPSRQAITRRGRPSGRPFLHAESDTQNNAGAGFAASPRRGTLSFVTQKFFCFGAINNRRNLYFLAFLFAATSDGCFTRACRWSLAPARPLYHLPVWCPGGVISKVQVT